jgi:hypothetical protein
MKQVGPEASKKRVIFTTPSLGLIVAEYTTAPIIVLFDLALSKEANDTFIGLITMFQAALARAHRSDTEKKGLVISISNGEKEECKHFDGAVAEFNRTDRAAQYNDLPEFIKTAGEEFTISQQMNRDNYESVSPRT